MNYKNFLIISLLCPILLSGQNLENNTSQNNELILSLIELSTQQLYDTANHYYVGNNYDTAIICFNLLIHTIPKTVELENHIRLAETYNKLANTYITLSDYRTAYDFYIKSLLICEEYNFVDIKARVSSNLGAVYYYLKQYEIAKQYFLKALDYCNDSTIIIQILNNLGLCEIIKGRTDSAYYFLNKSIQISKRHGEIHLHNMLNNTAVVYQNEKKYDSALYYFRLASKYSKINNDIRIETTNLSDMGKLFFEVGSLDSAQYYIDLSNKIASENKFLNIISDNYLILSEIEKSKRRFEKALDYHSTYTELKDSIYNTQVFSDINQTQRLYEVSKTNRQIEELVIDLKVKERTIYQQKIIRRIIICFFILICCIFIYILFLHKKIRKFQKKLQLHDERNELKSKILSIIEDKSIICDPDFSINKLAELAQSNRNYVSEIINNSYNQNFRSLLNTYRIREAQQLFSKKDTSKFTIDTVANLVGYKSPKSFYDAFKRVTGITPSTYLKSKQE